MTKIKDMKNVKDTGFIFSILLFDINNKAIAVFDWSLIWNDKTWLKQIQQRVFIIHFYFRYFIVDQQEWCYLLVVELHEWDLDFAAGVAVGVWEGGDTCEKFVAEAWNDALVVLSTHHGERLPGSYWKYEKTWCKISLALREKGKHCKRLPWSWGKQENMM